MWGRGSQRECEGPRSERNVRGATVAPTIWQIASGDWDRDYTAEFHCYDLMFVGPGDLGRFSVETYKSLVPKRMTDKKLGAIRSFCSEVEPGDIVLLRKGHRVVSIGLAAEEGYSHDSTFDDMYGWDLSHTQRVLWQRQLDADLEALQAGGDLFGHRKQIPMFTRVNDEAVVEPLRPLFDKVERRPPNPRPSESDMFEILSPEQVAEELFSRGLSNQATEQVLEAIERQRRLLRWYAEHGAASGRPDEHEVVAHMVLPLLLALGWSEQLLAVEWRNVDLAGFRSAPTTHEQCVLVCEAKRLEHGLQNTWEQAFRYVSALDLCNCQKILVTQGGRFYLFARDGSGWADKLEPAGYLNVEKIRLNHLVPRATSAIDTLMGLSPWGVEQPLPRAVERHA